MIDFRIANSDFTPLKDSPRQLILARNGIFLAKENAAFRAIIRQSPDAGVIERLKMHADGRPWEVSLKELQSSLVPLDEHLELKVRIRQRDSLRAVAFFRRVFLKHRTEAFLYLTVNPDTGETGLHCPVQWNDPASVRVDVDDQMPEGRLRLGSWHSHPCGPFHSGVDEEDEAQSDGLHLVTGHLNRADPETVAALVVWGRRHVLTLDEVVELETNDHTWIEQLRFKARREGAQ